MFNSSTQVQRLKHRSGNIFKYSLLTWGEKETMFIKVLNVHARLKYRFAQQQ